MSKGKYLKIISGGNSLSDYSYEELINNLKGKYDEFTKYRVSKEIKKQQIKLINELKHNNFINDPEGDRYLNYMVENYSKLSLDSKTHLYEFIRELLKGEKNYRGY